MTSFSSIAGGTRRNSSFEDFWTAFRSAAIRNDWETLKEKTQFPLEVHGTLDSSPRRLVKWANFTKVFQKFLRQNVSEGGNNYRSRAQLMAYGNLLRKATIHEDWARVGDMQFAKDKQGRWQLILIYIDDEEPSSSDGDASR